METVDLTNYSVKEKIQFFHNIVEHNQSEVDFRSSDDLSIPDTKFGIEVLSNVYYAKSPENAGKTTRFKSSFSVQLSAPGVVSVSQFMAGYLSAHAELTAAYVQAEYADKRIGLVYIGIIEVSDSEANFSITTTVVESSMDPYPGRACASYYGEDEDFLDGTALDGNGHCDLSAPFASYNSMTKTEDALNDLFVRAAEYSAPADLPVRFTGFVDIDGNSDFETVSYTAYEFINQNDDAPEDNYRDLLFWSTDYTDDGCVDNEDINWYTCNMFNTATYYNGDDRRPLGKLPASVELYFDFPLCGSCSFIAHAMDVMYGTPFYMQTSTGGGYTNPTVGPYLPDFDIDDIIMVDP